MSNGLWVISDLLQQTPSVLRTLNKQQVATARLKYGNACCEEILKVNEVFYLARLQCLISSSHLQGLVHHSFYCLDTGDYLPTVQEERPPSHCLSFHIFYKY
jgi:hypothetical protein